jgi:AcrR family transcriptional regulator
LTRDRFATRATLLNSAASIIASGGLPQLGVNSLAHAANCDNVLIYRYFGGLDGVLAALGAERMLWPHVELTPDDANHNPSLADSVTDLLLEEWAALSSATLILQSATAELTTHNPLGAAASFQRTELHAQIIAKIQTAHHVPPYIDLPALLELLSAALTLFALRSAHAEHSELSESFDPATPQGWRRIEKMLSAITRALLDVDR